MLTFSLRGLVCRRFGKFEGQIHKRTGQMLNNIERPEVKSTTQHDRYKSMVQVFKNIFNDISFTELISCTNTRQSSPGMTPSL